MLDGHNGIAAAGRKRLATRNAGNLFRLFSVVCERRARVLGLPI